MRQCRIMPQQAAIGLGRQVVTSYIWRIKSISLTAQVSGKRFLAIELGDRRDLYSGVTPMIWHRKGRLHSAWEIWMNRKAPEVISARFIRYSDRHGQGRRLPLICGVPPLPRGRWRGKCLNDKIGYIRTISLFKTNDAHSRLSG